MQKSDPEHRTAVFQIRMRPSVKAAGEAAAKAENRSFASLMETILINYLRQPASIKDKDHLR